MLRISFSAATSSLQCKPQLSPSRNSIIFSQSSSVSFCRAVIGTLMTMFTQTVSAPPQCLDGTHICKKRIVSARASKSQRDDIFQMSCLLSELSVSWNREQTDSPAQVITEAGPRFNHAQAPGRAGRVWKGMEMRPTCIPRTNNSHDESASKTGQVNMPICTMSRIATGSFDERTMANPDNS